MMSLSTVFWLLIAITTIIGGMRGWAKEILVMFSLVLASFLDTIIITFVPGVDAAFQAQDPAVQFWVRALFLLAMAFFGYESPAIASALSGKGKREKLQDVMLGAVIGFINGYLLVGSLWYYLHLAQYPLSGVIAPNDPAVLNYISFLPPKFVGPPWIYFAVGIAFVFVLIVFV